MQYEMLITTRFAKVPKGFPSYFFCFKIIGFCFQPEDNIESTPSFASMKLIPKTGQKSCFAKNKYTNSFFVYSTKSIRQALPIRPGGKWLKPSPMPGNCMPWFVPVSRSTRQHLLWKLQQLQTENPPRGCNLPGWRWTGYASIYGNLPHRRPLSGQNTRR